MCPRRESNPDLRFRKPPFYPLNYRGCWWSVTDAGIGPGKGRGGSVGRIGSFRIFNRLWSCTTPVAGFLRGFVSGGRRRPERMVLPAGTAGWNGGALAYRPHGPESPGWAGATVMAHRLCPGPVVPPPPAVRRRRGLAGRPGGDLMNHRSPPRGGFRFPKPVPLSFTRAASSGRRCGRS